MRENSSKFTIFRGLAKFAVAVAMLTDLLPGTNASSSNHSGKPNDKKIATLFKSTIFSEDNNDFSTTKTVKNFVVDYNVTRDAKLNGPKQLFNWLEKDEDDWYVVPFITVADMDNGMHDEENETWTSPSARGVVKYRINEVIQI